jgi:hypothetical protein
MTAYADTAFLCSLHAPDAHTGRVVAWLQRQRAPLPFTGLHRLEFRNALRLRVFRKEITPEQRELGIQAMLSDLAADVFAYAEPAWPEVLLEAERLSAGHSESIGTRSLDILHVASALVLGARDFLTFDIRQGTLAKAAGLRLPTV